jgi:charged multivesicular body protein 1
MGNKAPSLSETVWNVKSRAKELERESRRAEKDEKKERAKIKKAIEKGNKDGAQIYAQNAIRKKHEALQYLKMASKMDAVASRLDSAEKSQNLTQSISQSVPQLQKILKDMSVEKMAANMEQFEKVFEDRKWSLKMKTLFVWIGVGFFSACFGF